MIDADRLRFLGNDLMRIAGELANLRGERQAQTLPVFPKGDVRAVIRSRRLRERMFPEGLFTDPAWDMLLELTAREAEGTTVSITGLCDASAVAPTTGLRWVSVLESEGLIEREADPHDKRKSNVRLSERGRVRISEYIVAARDARLPIA